MQRNCNKHNCNRKKRKSITAQCSCKTGFAVVLWVMQTALSTAITRLSRLDRVDMFFTIILVGSLAGIVAILVSLKIIILFSLVVISAACLAVRYVSKVDGLVSFTPKPLHHFLTTESWCLLDVINDFLKSSAIPFYFSRIAVWFMFGPLEPQEFGSLLEGTSPRLTHFLTTKGLVNLLPARFRRLYSTRESPTSQQQDDNSRKNPSQFQQDDGDAVPVSSQHTNDYQSPQDSDFKQICCRDESAPKFRSQLRQHPGDETTSCSSTSLSNEAEIEELVVEFDDEEDEEELTSLSSRPSRRSNHLRARHLKRRQGLKTQLQPTTTLHQPSSFPNDNDSFWTCLEEDQTVEALDQSSRNSEVFSTNLNRSHLYQPTIENDNFHKNDDDGNDEKEIDVLTDGSPGQRKFTNVDNSTDIKSAVTRKALRELSSSSTGTAENLLKSTETEQHLSASHRIYMRSAPAPTKIMDVNLLQVVDFVTKPRTPSQYSSTNNSHGHTMTHPPCLSSSEGVNIMTNHRSYRKSNKTREVVDATSKAIEIPSSTTVPKRSRRATAIGMADDRNQQLRIRTCSLLSGSRPSGDEMVPLILKLTILRLLRDKKVDNLVTCLKNKLFRLSLVVALWSLIRNNSVVKAASRQLPSPLTVISLAVSLYLGFILRRPSTKPVPTEATVPATSQKGAIRESGPQRKLNKDKTRIRMNDDKEMSSLVR